MITNGNFKLIAIIPLAKCDKKFHKTLQPEKIYQFHQEYRISLDSLGRGVESIVVDKEKAAPEWLFALDNGIRLSFSAVVGKNGTGKSTLMELFYRAVYFSATRSKFGKETILGSSSKKLEGDLKWLKTELRHLLSVIRKYTVSQKPTNPVPSETDWLYLIKFVRRHRLKFNTDRADDLAGLGKAIAAELKSNISDMEAALRAESKGESEMVKGFHVSVIYDTGSEIWELRCAKGGVSHIPFDAKGKPVKSTDPIFDLQKFFYTIVLNYAHHGLNALSVGRWIDKLFHKNDAYITPLVLNPMREDGNIDINKEIRLSKERLATTILYDLAKNGNSLQLGKYEVSKLLFAIKNSKYRAPNGSIDSKTGEVFHWELINKKYGIKKNAINRPNGQAALEYLSRKLTKVSNSYDFLMDASQGAGKGLSDFLDRDKSHVTRKIRQTVNYLSADLRIIKKLWTTSQNEDPAFIELSNAQIIEYMRSFDLELTDIKPTQLIEYAFPAFFDVDFEFLYDGKKIRFSEMSSGEQQMIFNSNAIIYHLYNLQSVSQTPVAPAPDTEKKRPAYEHVNIILDEMELYYHPEMQRRYVADMVRNLNRLGADMGIEGIHVCILTHSPFVLSDIPVQSTLHLRESSDTEQSYGHQSFGANVHDLLRKDFFLRDGFMGEHANRQINRLIDSLRAHQYIDAEVIGAITKLLIQKRIRQAKDCGLTEDFARNSILSKQQCEELIAIIGEPVLYQGIMELYHQAFGKAALGFIDNQIEFLNRLKDDKI